MKIAITGTTGGIGGAVKKLALSLGHEVIDINRDDFKSLFPGSGFPDGMLDAVVFCTGVCPVKPVALSSDELFVDTFKVNVGLFLKLMRHIVSERLYNPQGMATIALSSVSAHEGWPGGAAYCASKGALSAMCLAMDAELKAKRIRVKALEPRYVRTKMFDQCAGRMGVDPSLAEDPAALALKILSLIESMRAGEGEK